MADVLVQRDEPLSRSIEYLGFRESHVVTRLIPRGEVSPESLSRVKERVRNTVTKMISRVRETYPHRRYLTDAHHIITDTLDAIVIVVVTRID